MKTSPLMKLSAPRLVATFLLLSLAAATCSAQVPIQDIQIFRNLSALNNRGDQGNAIDGDPGTWSFLTPTGTADPHMAALDLGSLTSINRLRIDKFGDTDDAGGGSGAPGIEPIDNMDLELVFTTDSGPLESRSYMPVTGLANGYFGNELINADFVDSSGFVDNDHHDFDLDGLFSLTFDQVQATGFGIRFARDSGDSTQFTHYRAREIDLMLDDAEQTISDIQIFRDSIPRPITTRGDAVNVIDDDIFTESFITNGGTTTPQIISLDLGGLVTVNRFRADKVGDIDDAGPESGAPGLAPIDNMDLQLLYSTDIGPLSERTYQPVTGLTNGFGGSELIQADAINALDATVDNDHHDTFTDGLYSLTFDSTQATALALRIERDAADSSSFTHYRSFELDALLNSTELPVSDIEAFAAELPPQPGDTALNNRGDQGNAIDGDEGTWSFLTPSGTAGPNTVALDVGESRTLGRLRVAKWGDTDDAGPNSGAPGIEPIDNMDLEILYTTDTGPLEERTYQPVTGLISGFNGEELIQADAVDSATGTVDNEHHNFAIDGWYSLTFDAIDATALAVRFSRDSGDSTAFTHYRAYEFQLFEAAAGLDGDYNSDGIVDAADYTVWRDNLGAPEGTLQNDGGIVGPIGTDHYNLWRSNFGRQLGSAALTAAVPEPATVALLGLAMIGLMLRRNN